MYPVLDEANTMISETMFVMTRRRRQSAMYLLEVAYNARASATPDSPRASAFSANTVEPSASLHSCDAPICDVRRCAVAVCKSPSPPKCLRVLRRELELHLSARAGACETQIEATHPRRRSGGTEPHVLRYHGMNAVSAENDRAVIRVFFPHIIIILDHLACPLIVII